MSEVIASLELEFLINNPEVLAQLKQTEEAVQQSTANMETQIGTASSNIQKGAIISVESLKIQLAQLQALANIEYKPEKLAQLNQKIAETVIEITRLKNVGKPGFDELGNSIVRDIGLIESLNANLKNLQTGLAQATSTRDIASFNVQIETTQAELSRIGNIGKTGFDELGNKLVDTEARTSRFSAALSRATDLGNIGARAITQLSRQIIGLGVGMLSFVVGAKVLEVLGTAFAGFYDIIKGGESARQLDIELTKKANDLYATQSTNVKLLVAEAENQNTTQLRQKEILDELNKVSPTYFGNLTDIHDIVSKLPDAFAKYNAALQLNSRIEAGKSLLTDKYKQLLTDQTSLLGLQGKKAGTDYASQFAESLKSMANIAGTIDLGKNVSVNGLSGLTDPAAKGLEKRISNTQRTIDQLTTGVLADQQKLQKNGGDIAGKGLAIMQKDATGVLELQKITVQNDANFQNSIYENHEKSIADRQAALKSGLADQLKVIDINEQQQKLSISLSENDKKLIAAKANAERLKATDEYNKNSANLNKTAADQAKQQARQDQESQKGKIALLQQVSDATEAFNRKALTADQQALTAISDKFDQLRKKIAAFNADPKNKNNKISQSTIDSLAPAETAAIDNQANLNENTYIQQDIETKKKLYADYEAYRLKVGSTIADTEYQDLLLSGKDFKTYLLNIKASIDQTDTTGAITDRATMVQKQLNESLEVQKRHLQDVIISDEDYQTKRAVLVQKSNDDIALLQKAADDSTDAATKQSYLNEIEQAKQNATDQQTALDVQHFETQGKYKILFDNIGKLSAASAISLITDGQKWADGAVKSSGITHDAYDKIIKDLLGIKESEKNLSADDLINVGSQLSSIGDGFESINSGVAGYVKQLGSMVSSLGQIGKESDKLQKDIAAGTNTSGDYINLIGTAVSGVVNLIGMVTSAAAEIKKAEEDYYNSIIAFQEQYNLALDEQVRLQYQLQGNIFIENFSNELADAAKSYNDATKQYNQSLIDLQKGQAIVDQKNAVNGANVGKGALTGAATGAAIGAIAGAGVLSWATTGVGALIGGVVGALGGLFGGKKKVNVLTPLLEQYPLLIENSGKFNESMAKTLIATNQVTDDTKKMLQHTIDYYDEQQKDIDQINSALTTLSGNLGSSLEDALVTAFENGTDAAQAFGGAVSDVIGNIVQQFLFEDIFTDQFNKLNDNLKSTVLSGGGSDGITADFVDFFKDAGPLVQQFEDGLKAAQAAGATQGLDLFAPTNSNANNSQTTLSGQIQGITADEANVLEGAIHGMQLAVVESNDILTTNGTIMQDQLSEMRSQTIVQMQIAVNTKRTADNTDALPAMRDTLKSIDSNTSSTNLTNVLRAAGHV